VLEVVSSENAFPWLRQGWSSYTQWANWQDAGVWAIYRDYVESDWDTNSTRKIWNGRGVWTSSYSFKA
jgi:hypothetical protein